MPKVVSDSMVEAMARRRFERVTPLTPRAQRWTWDWLPPAAKRQWLEEAREDLEAAFAAAPEGDRA